MKQAEPQRGSNKMQIKLEVADVCLSVVWTHIEEDGGKIHQNVQEIFVGNTEGEALKVPKLNKLMTHLLKNTSINVSFIY